MLEEEKGTKTKQDWKKWGTDLRRAAKTAKHKHCPENYGIIRCGSGIQCSDWMSKKSYQSLQSSLPKAALAPFSDYNSSISDILTQVCWMLSIRKHHLPTSHVGVNITLWIEFSTSLQVRCLLRTTILPI